MINTDIKTNYTSSLASCHKYKKKKIFAKMRNEMEKCK